MRNCLALVFLLSACSLSLAASPTPTQPGQQRRIKVRVTRPKLIVRARNSYGLNPAENIEPTGKQK